MEFNEIKKKIEDAVTSGNGTPVKVTMEEGSLTVRGYWAQWETSFTATEYADAILVSFRKHSHPKMVGMCAEYGTTRNVRGWDYKMDMEIRDYLWAVK